MIILHDRYHAIVVWAFFLKERRSFLEYSISLDAWVCLHLLNHIYKLGILNDAIALFRAHRNDHGTTLKYSDEHRLSQFCRLRYIIYVST